MRSVLKCFVVLALPALVRMQEGSDLDFVKAVSNYGYPVDIHKVETQDGYLLTVFRIPHGKTSNVSANGPILLNHGMFGSSENFVSLGPKESLGYVLADSGYDVWIMNCRGTWHSRRHVSYNTSQQEFWMFSWHEIGIYDLPAVIDYILNATNEKQLSYIGHSQGVTSVLVMGSERPEYNKKLKVMIGLAPGAIYNNIKNPMMRMLSMFLPQLQMLANELKIYELPPPFMPADEIRKFFKALCMDSDLLRNSCTSIFLLVSESIPNLHDENSIKHLFPFVLASTSVRQPLHYGQLIAAKQFQQYDWGQDGNLKKYGTPNPPLYNLRKADFPAVLLYSSSDTLVTEDDVKILATQLPNLVAVHKVQKGVSHMDFIFTDIESAVCKPVLKALKMMKLKKYRKLSLLG